MNVSNQSRLPTRNSAVEPADEMGKNIKHQGGKAIFFQKCSTIFWAICDAVSSYVQNFYQFFFKRVKRLDPREPSQKKIIDAAKRSNIVTPQPRTHLINSRPPLPRQPEQTTVSREKPKRAEEQPRIPTNSSKTPCATEMPNRPVEAPAIPASSKPFRRVEKPNRPVEEPIVPKDSSTAPRIGEKPNRPVEEPTIPIDSSKPSRTTEKPNLPLQEQIVSGDHSYTPMMGEMPKRTLEDPKAPIVGKTEPDLSIPAALISKAKYKGWETKLLKFDIKNESFFKRLIPPDTTDPFLKEFKALSEKHHFTSIIENLDYQEIQRPNREALELQAALYKKKYAEYGVNIKVAHINDLNKVVEKLKDEYKDPGYAGVIVGYDNAMERHTLPLLCYFGPQNESPRKISFFTMDVAGLKHHSSMASNVRQNLLKKGYQEKDFFQYVGMHRQADEHSCRSGSLNILCNALLSLKIKGHTNGFSEALQDCDQKNNDLYEIPADWSVHEQIFSKKEGKGEILHIRDLASKKPQKRANPRKVSAVRQSQKQDVHMRYLIKAFSGAKSLETLKGLTPPKGVEVDLANGTIIYTETLKVDTYLVRKAMRRKNKLEKLYQLESA